MQHTAAAAAGWRLAGRYVRKQAAKSAIAVIVLAAPLAAVADPPAPAKTVSPSAENIAPHAKWSETAAKMANRGNLGEREARHVALLDEALAPAKAYTPSVGDAVKIRDAIQALRKNDLDVALRLKGEIQDPIGQKLIDWFRLRSGFGKPGEYREFLDKNPAWPDRKLLTRRLEEALFTQGGSASSIKAYFKDGEPATGVGRAALASAYLAEGDAARAKSLAARAWRETEIPASLETGFLDRFRSLLTEADHKWRLDRFLVDDIRWTGERNERAAFARRVIPLLSAPEKKKAEARLAVFAKSSGAATRIKGLPAETVPDWGLVFHRIQVLRRSDNADEAVKLMLGAPTDPDKVANLDQWWVERRTLAYGALKSGKPKLAYELVREAGPLSVNPLKEQTFMSGWLALRFLNDAKAAEPHFVAMRKAVDGPLSSAKAEYWLGRTAEALGDKAKAAQHFRLASRYGDTFHGLLAMQKVEPGRRNLELEPPAMPTKEQIERFNTLDAVRAVVVARKAGLDRSITQAFLLHLPTTIDTEAESGLVAHLAEAIDDTQLAVRVGKSAITRGHNLITYSYPVHPFPDYKPLRPPPEKAFLLGIARQESEFNPETVSGAGARGVLQVMPITANHVCRDYKIKCDHARLLSDPSYNAKIASAYIADRMGEFSGSYVLGLAGYNAGPGRARQWIKEFGDPRDPKVDPIDWIERIPFQETREYVAKVLSNIQVYRARLGQGATALRLDEDLARARGRAAGAATDQSRRASEVKSDGQGSALR